MAQRILLLVFLIVGIQDLYGGIPKTAQELVDNCRKAEIVIDEKASAQFVDNAIDGGICFGYIAGSMHAATIFGHLDICTPKGSNTEQLMKVFLKYMDNHPEDLHRPAAEMLIKAIRLTFPCGR